MEVFLKGKRERLEHAERHMQVYQQELVERLETQIPAADLYLMDEHCSSVRADEALAALAKGKLLTKTVVLTTAINPERVADFLNAGVRDVRLKPYTNEEVAELLRSLNIA